MSAVVAVVGNVVAVAGIAIVVARSVVCRGNIGVDRMFGVVVAALASSLMFVGLLLWPIAVAP